MSDIDTAVVVDGLKALDPKWPIREADIERSRREDNLGNTAHSFHKRKTLDCCDAKLSTALADLGRLLIFWQIIPASHCTHIRKFEYRYTTWNRPVTFKQRVLLAARQVASGILRKNLACKLGVLLLNRLRSRGRGPFHDNKGGTLLFAVSTPYGIMVRNRTRHGF